MRTFDSAEVAPIDEMLERTHYVKALRADIERLANAGLEAAFGETMKADELEHWIETCDRLTAELADLRRQLTEAQRWQPAPMGRYATAQGFIEVLSQGDSILVVSGLGNVLGERDSAWATLPTNLAVFCRIGETQDTEGGEP